MRTCVEARGFELVAELVEDLAADRIVAAQAQQTIDAEHAEANGLHVKRRHGAAERFGGLDEFGLLIGGGQILQSREQRVQSCQRRCGLL